MIVSQKTRTYWKSERRYILSRHLLNIRYITNTKLSTTRVFTNMWENNPKSTISHFKLRTWLTPPPLSPPFWAKKRVASSQTLPMNFRLRACVDPSSTNYCTLRLPRSPPPPPHDPPRSLPFPSPSPANNIDLATALYVAWYIPVQPKYGLFFFWSLI